MLKYVRWGFLLLFGVGLLIGDSIGNHANSQVMCPSNFTILSQTSETITCRFSARLTTPPDVGQDPRNTDEGRQLMGAARDACQALGGAVSGGALGTDGVFVDCVLDKPEPTPEPPVIGTPEPELPEVIDFDLSDRFRPGSAEADIAASLVNVCNGLLSRTDLNMAESDLLQRCRDIDSESNADLQFLAVQNIAAKQYADIVNLINFQNVIQVGDIGNRLSSMRSIMAQNARDVAGLELQHPSPGLLAKTASRPIRGGAAGDSNGRFSRLGAFLLAANGRGDKADTEFSSGFDYSSSSATLGVDYLVNNSTIIGLALGYGSSESELSNRSGAIDIRTDNVSVYGSKYFSNGWFVDAIAGTGKVETQNRREIDFTVSDSNVDQQANGQFDSDQTILSLGLGKSYQRFVDIDVAARLNYIDTAIERFSESTNLDSSGFGLALEIDSQEIQSLTSDVSLTLSKPYSHRFGVFVPTVTARWVHEFEKGDDALFGRFLADVSSFDFQQSGVALGPTDGESTIFSVPLEKVDSNYGNLLFGVTALFANQLSANVSVSRTLGINNFSHTYYSLTLRRDFQ